MELTVETVDGVAVLAPRGEWDAAASPAFKACWTMAFEQGCRHFVIDFSRVDFIDSSALSSLVSLFKRVNPTLNGQVRLFALHDDVRRIFAETRLDRVFDILATREEALEGLIRIS